MTNPNKTLLVIVLDRSGSMARIRNDMEGGLETYLQSQKEQPGECEVTLVQFDHHHETVFSNKPIAEVEHVSFSPGGSTALYDAVCYTIDTVGYELAARPEHERPGRVLVVIITDGEENASREFNFSQVKSRLDRQQNHYGWIFTFLGSNINAVELGQKMGIAYGRNMDYRSSSAGTGATWSALGAHTNTLRSTGNFGSYSGAERVNTMAEDEKPEALSTDASSKKRRAAPRKTPQIDAHHP